MERDLARQIAREGLSIGAIKLNSENPFTWASGFRMPIYNDNRMFLFHPDARELIAEGFKGLIYENSESRHRMGLVIAGTSTAGISPATTLADKLRKPLVYVRDKPKDHGLKNQIEGIDASSDLSGYNVFLIEDLVSTGGSSAKAVQALRDANANCDYCFSIFNYGFDEARRMFSGEVAFDKDSRTLKSPCNTSSLVRYDLLLQVARDERYVDASQIKMLEEWREDPFGWGEKRGFARVEKK